MKLPFVESEDLRIHRYSNNVQEKKQEKNEEDEKYVQEQIELFSSKSSDREYSNRTSRVVRRFNWNFLRSNN